MDEIFGLKLHLCNIAFITKKIEIPTWGKHFIFVTDFVILGRWSFIFFTMQRSQKNMLIWEKNPICQQISPKKIQKVLMQIDKMENRFLNSGNFAQYTLSTLEPLCTPKHWSKCQRLAKHLSFFSQPFWIFF